MFNKSLRWEKWLWPFRTKNTPVSYFFSWFSLNFSCFSPDCDLFCLMHEYKLRPRHYWLPYCVLCPSLSNFSIMWCLPVAVFLEKYLLIHIFPLSWLCVFNHWQPHYKHSPGPLQFHLHFDTKIYHKPHFHYFNTLYMCLWWLILVVK